MNSILKAVPEDFRLLAEMGKLSFIESHGSSASETDINKYVEEKYTFGKFKKELIDRDNIFHIIYQKDKPAGYSKIILNSPHTNIESKNVTKMERLYLLKEFYGLKAGLELFNFNLEISKVNYQFGMWLYVWMENNRAVNFYKKAGFEIIGNYDFKLTETHSNPNHLMLKIY